MSVTYNHAGHVLFYVVALMSICLGIYSTTESIAVENKLEASSVCYPLAAITDYTTDKGERWIVCSDGNHISEDGKERVLYNECKR